MGEGKYCEIPKVGTEGGYITRESDGKVLGLSQGSHIAKWEKKEEDRLDQIWERNPLV